MADLYGKCDCLISLHRSEGFGLSVAEAMLRGKPPIGTDWSGTTDFVSSETGVPISFDLIPARDPQHVYDFPNLVWADPRIAEAATALRTLREPARCAELGELARAEGRRRFSAEVFCSQVATLIKPGFG